MKRIKKFLSRAGKKIEIELPPRFKEVCEECGKDLEDRDRILTHKLGLVSPIGETDNTDAEYSRDSKGNVSSSLERDDQGSIANSLNSSNYCAISSTESQNSLNVIPEPSDANRDNVSYAFKSLQSCLQSVCVRDHLLKPVDSPTESASNICTTNALLELDNLACVPSSHPTIVQIELQIRSFATTLTDVFLKVLRPENQNEAIQFSLKSIGSFPSGTKVGYADEFDYLCEFDVLPEKADWKKQNDWDVQLEDPFYKDMDEKLFNFTKCLLKPLVEQPLDKSVVRISDVFKHGPATCIEFTWTCVDGCQQQVNVDLTPAICLANSAIDNDITARIESLPRAFQGLKNHIGRHYFICKHGDWILSTCSWDGALFSELEKAGIPNLRPIFRCLKIVWRELIPSGVVYDNTSIKGYQITHTVSSHVLKSLFFQELCCCPFPHLWRGSRVVDRLVSILGRLTITGKNAFSGGTWPQCRDIISQEELGENFAYNQELLTKESVLKHIEDLQEYLSQTYTAESDSEIFSSGVPSTIISSDIHGTYIRTRGRMYLAKTELMDKVSLPDIRTKDDSPPNTSTGRNPCCPVYVYMKKPSSNVPHHKHPWIIWCHDHIIKAQKRNQGSDLRQLSASDFASAWILIGGGTLTNIDNLNIGGKENIIKKFESYNKEYGPKLWKYYLRGSYRESAEINKDFLEFIDTLVVSELETLIGHVLGIFPSDAVADNLDRHPVAGADQAPGLRQWRERSSHDNKSAIVFHALNAILTREKEKGASSSESSLKPILFDGNTMSEEDSKFVQYCDAGDMREVVLQPDLTITTVPVSPPFAIDDMEEPEQSTMPDVDVQFDNLFRNVIELDIETNGSTLPTVGRAVDSSSFEQNEIPMLGDQIIVNDDDLDIDTEYLGYAAGEIVYK